LPGFSLPAWRLVGGGIAASISKFKTRPRAFFGEGGLLFYLAGHTPVNLEVVFKGHWMASRQAPYGQGLVALLPAIATVPGAPLASFKALKDRLGAELKQGTTTHQYFKLPTKCAKSGLPFKTEVVFGRQFGGEREFGIPAKTVTATYKAPCPR
jgi:hypothetical protein